MAKTEFIWCEEENCGETLWQLSELKILWNISHIFEGKQDQVYGS